MKKLLLTLTIMAITANLNAFQPGITESSDNFSNANSSNSDRETFTVNGVSFTMVRVDGGMFTMGATQDQGSKVEKNEKPAHDVTLSSFMIGETEVTQALWLAVMGENPSFYKGDLSCPVEHVSWADCQEFIKKLNAITGKTFRLPTEAEWEFAARGGNKSKHYKYSGSNDLDDVAWYVCNSGDRRLSYEESLERFENNNRPHPVAKKAPNELGLYDMSGNVFEWCNDWYGTYEDTRQTNPKGPSSSTSSHVYRGGSYAAYDGCRCAYRMKFISDVRIQHIGLRLGL